MFYSYKPSLGYRIFIGKCIWQGVRVNLMRTNEYKWDLWQSCRTFSFDLNPKRMSYIYEGKTSYTLFFGKCRWQKGLPDNMPSYDSYMSVNKYLINLFDQESMEIEIVTSSADDFSLQGLYDERASEFNSIFYGGYFKYSKEYEGPRIRLYLDTKFSDGKIIFNLLSDFCLGKIPDDTRRVELEFNFDGFDNVEECDRFLQEESFKYRIDGFRISVKNQLIY